MRFFKHHPALATILVVLLLGAVSGVAYAIVDRVYLSIDTSMTTDEIEADVQAQLQAHGKTGTVKATKDDGVYSVEIASEDPSMGKIDLELAAPDGTKYQLSFDIPPTLPEPQQRAVGEAVSKALTDIPANRSDAATEKLIRDELVKAGVANFTVRVKGNSIAVVVKP